MILMRNIVHPKLQLQNDLKKKSRKQFLSNTNSPNKTTFPKHKQKERNYKMVP